MATIKHPYYTTDWTLGQMWDFDAHPYMEPIVRFIEPKIVRGIHLPCWAWGGEYTKLHKDTIYEQEYPQVYIPIDMMRPKDGRKKFYVHRYLAETFWNMEKGEVVYRTCHNKACVNPQHFAISYRNDPEYR